MLRLLIGLTTIMTDDPKSPMNEITQLLEVIKTARAGPLAPVRLPLALRLRGLLGRRLAQLRRSRQP